MPEDTPAATADNATLIAAFLAEGGADGADAAPAAAAPPDDSPDPPAAEAQPTEGEAQEGATEGEAATETAAEEDASEAVYDTVALAAAIDAEDPRAFIDALGPAAEVLLGGKAHAALRRQAGDLKKAEGAAKKFEAHLEAKYGDPIKARKAAAEGDINAFLDNIERQYGAPWTAMVKAVNDAMAGKPARVENVAEAAKRAELAQTAAREEARAKVRQDITRHVSTVDKALAKACPSVVDRVYEKMRTGWAQGINTPAKALALVKKELKTEAAALVKLFAPQKPKPKTTVPLPRETRETPGRKMTDAEMREEFLRQEGLWRGP